MDRTKQLHVVKAAKAPRKRFSPLNIHTLEYNVLANLVTQHYQHHNEIDFQALLSIPLQDRLPALIEAYGKKTVYRLLVTMLREFNNKLLLPKAKKLTDTRLSMAACELMLESYEDQLSLEDIILFLQRAKGGLYGPLKNMMLPSSLFHKLELYRQERHAAFKKIKEAQAAAFKEMGAVPRTASEPTAIGDLLQQSFSFDLPHRA